MNLWGDAYKRFRRNRSAMVAAIFLVMLAVACILVPELSHWRYDRADLSTGPTFPSWNHWMGTDYFGRDICARIFFGGRISLTVGILATALSFAIGITWGTVAGYWGGKVDALMMRIVDVLYTFPLLIFVILLMVFFANTQSPVFSVWMFFLRFFVKHPDDPSYIPVFQIFIVFVALGSISWLTTARIVRGQVLSLKHRAFVEAAQCIGVHPIRILTRHLIPNAMGPILVYATLTIPEVMMTEAFLSFLGLGTQEPLSSWGLMASTGADVMDLYWHHLAFPAMMLSITLICFNFLGDGLRDALDPHSRKEGE